MHVEILNDKQGHRAQSILQAMIATARRAGFTFEVTSTYKGCGELLMLWGAGRRDHMIAWADQLKRRKHCVGFDLGYWKREKEEGCVRVHIDTRHPNTSQVLRTSDVPKPGYEFVLREDADPKGPIMIVGLGNKSRHMRDEQPEQWEQGRYLALRDEFPHHVVEWRPKYRVRPFETTMRIAPDVPIVEGLRGRSLVVCAHSNVALDACLAGIPVRCDDGIAHTLYYRNEKPTRAERLQLLNRSTWWNWHPTEAPQLWRFIRQMLYSGSTSVVGSESLRAG